MRIGQICLCLIPFWSGAFAQEAHTAATDVSQQPSGAPAPYIGSGPGWAFERASTVGKFGTCFLRLQADPQFAVSISDIFPSPEYMSLMVSAPPTDKPFVGSGGYLGTWSTKPGTITLEMRSMGGAALHGLLGAATDPRGIAMSALSSPSALDVIDTAGRAVGHWNLPPVTAYDQGRFVQCYSDEVLHPGQPPRKP
jgi:hypothetical protein